MSTARLYKLAASEQSPLVGTQSYPVYETQYRPHSNPLHLVLYQTHPLQHQIVVMTMDNR